LCPAALPYRKPGVKRRREKPLQGEQPRRVTLQAFGSGRAGASFTIAEEKLENRKYKSQNEIEIEYTLNIIHFIKKAIPPQTFTPHRRKNYRFPPSGILGICRRPGSPALLIAREGGLPPAGILVLPSL